MGQTQAGYGKRAGFRQRNGREPASGKPKGLGGRGVLTTPPPTRHNAKKERKTNIGKKKTKKEKELREQRMHWQSTHTGGADDADILGGRERAAVYDQIRCKQCNGRRYGIKCFKKREVNPRARKHKHAEKFAKQTRGVGTKRNKGPGRVKY